VSEQAIVA